MKREPTEMELRVAEALWRHTLEGIPGHGKDNVKFTDELRDMPWLKGFIDQARIAIKAMREPTGDMLNEAHDFPFDGMSYVSGYRVGMYEAMIDAASPPHESEQSP